MNSGSSIVNFIHHLRMAYDYAEDYKRSNPGSKGAKLFEQYMDRIKWIPTNLITHPFLPQQAIDGVRREWNSDVFQMPAMHEKFALLDPDKRQLVETLMDGLLKGENVEFVNP